ncbi:MAG: 50S ribosomal protein L10 [Kiritimatiellae bacterium]|nr:50S ribosomal protein L10 [Kiritimatiellia bacterium]
MRPEKIAIIEELRTHVEGSSYIFLADCKGMNMEGMSELREKLSETSSSLMVVKNSYLGKATAECGRDSLSTLLEGPTAMVTGTGDVSDVAKALNNFSKENKTLELKGGWFSDQTLSVDDVKAIANIPPREVLYGQLVGTLVAPMTQVVGVMNQKLCSLLYVIQAAADKKTQ